jgi:hypothetical protein
MTKGRLFVGMQGPGAAITLVVPAPFGITDFVTATIEVTLEIHPPSGPVVQVGPGRWSWAEKTATGGRVTMIPDGTEFVVAGPTQFATQLRIGAVTYDAISWTESVYANQLVSA